jgi:hypothetical protein
LLKTDKIYLLKTNKSVVLMYVVNIDPVYPEKMGITRGIFLTPKVLFDFSST